MLSEVMAALRAGQSIRVPCDSDEDCWDELWYVEGSGFSITKMPNGQPSDAYSPDWYGLQEAFRAICMARAGVAFNAEWAALCGAALIHMERFMAAV